MVALITHADWVAGGGFNEGATYTGNKVITGNLTTGGHHLFSADATKDIGASGATRPRDLYLSRNLEVGGVASGGGLVVSYEMDFTETAGAGTYTATLVLPASTMVQNLWVINRVQWTAGGSTATLNIRNTATASAYMSACTLHNTSSISLNVLDTWTHISSSPGLSTNFPAVSYPSGTTITATVTTTGAGGTVGRTSVILLYTVPTISAATKGA